MSVEFRQRSAGEILGMLKRQKWMIILPMLTMTAAIGYVVNRLPSIYESTSLLTVKPPTISANLVQSLTTEDLSQRLQTINKEVLSRSSLEPMVQKYDLYKLERASGLPMEPRPAEVSAVLGSRPRQGSSPSRSKGTRPTRRP